MSILVFGANGFIGSHVCATLSRAGENVVKAVRSSAGKAGEKIVDLNDAAAITAVLNSVSPAAIVQAAGVTDGSEVAQNPLFTRNLLEAVEGIGLRPRKIIILGSASEYGVVKKKELPVNETTPLRASTPYGRSKVEEERLALGFRKSGLPVVVARIFNPIGIGMSERFLVPRIVSQIKQYIEGSREVIEVNRLDAKRDYIHADDIARAIYALIKNNTRFDVYNLGSGRPTTNGEVVNFLIEDSKIEPRPEIIETMKEPEPLYAACADIDRVTSELGWKPSISIEEAIKEIIDASE